MDAEIIVKKLLQKIQAKTDFQKRMTTLKKCELIKTFIENRRENLFYKAYDNVEIMWFKKLYWKYKRRLVFRVFPEAYVTLKQYDSIKKTFIENPSEHLFSKGSNVEKLRLDIDKNIFENTCENSFSEAYSSVKVILIEKYFFENTSGNLFPEAIQYLLTKKKLGGCHLIHHVGKHSVSATNAIYSYL